MIQNKRYDFFDGLMLAALAAMFAPTFHRLAAYGWKASDYTHAYFILPVALWFFYKKKDLLVKNEEVSLPDAAFFAAGLGLYVFSAKNLFMFLEAFSFVVMVWAVLKMRFTSGSLKHVVFPAAYLLFLVPPPQLAIDAATLPLKKISTYGSYALLKIAQLPVAVHGAMLKVGDYELFVADACSGFRSIVTLLALGAVWAHAQKLPVSKKWIIFSCIVPIGIAGNVLRIFLTGCISHYFGIKYAEGFFHEFSGGVMFLFTVFGLMMVTDLVSKRGHAK